MQNMYYMYDVRKWKGIIKVKELGLIKWKQGMEKKSTYTKNVL